MVRHQRSPSPSASHSSKNGRRRSRSPNDVRMNPRGAARQDNDLFPGHQHRHHATGRDDRSYPPRERPPRRDDRDRRDERRDDHHRDNPRAGYRDDRRDDYRSSRPDRRDVDYHDRSYRERSRDRRHRSRERERARDYPSSTALRRDAPSPRHREGPPSSPAHRLEPVDTSSRPPSRRDSVRDGTIPTQSSSPQTPPVVEEDKQAGRRARLEEWKAKKDRERADRIAQAGPENPTEVENPNANLMTPGIRFDPKEIARKAAPSGQSGQGSNTALGGDVNIPAKSTPTFTGPTVKPAFAKAKSSGSLNLLQKQQQKGLGAFGLGARQQSDSSARGGLLDLGEERQSRRKLEKLPMPPLEGDAANADSEYPSQTDDGHEHDEDQDFAAVGSDEEETAAARAAYEKRKQRMDEAANQDVDMDAQPAEVPTDVVMTDAPDNTANGASNEEEVDPLDAFMANLTETAAPGLKADSASQNKAEEASKSDDPFDVDEGLTTMSSTRAQLQVPAATSKKNKRDVPVIDHAKVTYEPFRKAFYTETSDVAKMTDEEVKSLRFDLDGMEVHGKDAPKPITKWSQLGLGIQSLEVIEHLGFPNPTPIQCQAIPAVMSGRDVMSVAKTGSGKTLAFLLPMFRHIKDQRPLKSKDGPIAMILAPTRELATQIHRDCTPWLKTLNLRAVCCYGGDPIKDQIANVKRGAEILVGTTGRIIDLLAANNGRVLSLHRVTYIVLDEADRMFDMGFEPQVHKIVGNIRPDRQTVMFSATFTKSAEHYARKLLNKPVSIVVGGGNKVAPEITQIIEVVPEEEKYLRLLNEIVALEDQDPESQCIVFVHSQAQAEELSGTLLKQGHLADSLHGGRDQDDRDDVIERFKRNDFVTLVATSVAARGLDIKRIKVVVNYDCPNHLEDYIHRVGRTGRAGNTGTAITFISPREERFASILAQALKLSNLPVPEKLEELIDSFGKKLEKGEKGVFAPGSGFGGSGIDNLEKKRGAQRAKESVEYGLEKSRATGENGEGEEELDENGEKSDKLRPPPVPGRPEVRKLFQEPSASSTINPTFTVHKRDDSVAKGAPDKMGAVSDAAAAINARLRLGGSVRTNAPIDNKGPDAGLYHSTLEINDYPQKARWAVTNRTNVAKILDATGCSITTKGNWYPEGSGPGPGDLPKLYVLVEGDTENVVTTAITDLIQLLRDALDALNVSDARAPARGGRFTIR